MKGMITALGAIIAAVVFIGIFAFFSGLVGSLLWYTFDDQLASITGNPAWGTVPFWNVFGFVYFLAFTVKGAASSSSK